MSGGMSSALDRVSRAADALDRASEARDQAIREAAEDHPLRRIAAAARLSHQRVHQIVRDKEKPPPPEGDEGR